jgi:DNA-damage-inducible protein J
MSKSDQIQVRIEPKTKAAAEAIFAKLGLKPSEAVRMFYHQVELNKGIPFEVRVPNAETVQAIRDLEEGRDLVRHRGMKEFKQTLRER